MTQLLIKNLMWIAKEKKIRIGDMEKECGVSVGYLSRSQKIHSISFNNAVAFTRYLGVTVEGVLQLDISEIEEKKKEILEKITALEKELEKVSGGKIQALGEEGETA